MTDLVQADRAGFFRIELSGRVYSAEAVLKSCYALADQAAFAISDFDGPGGRLVIHLKPRHPASIEKITLMLADKMLEFELRERLETRTRPVRNLIHAAALAEVNLLDEADSATRGAEPE